MNLTDGADFVKQTSLSSVRLFLPLGPGVCTAVPSVVVLKMVFSLPVALCLPVDARLFPLARDSTDGWYSLTDASGADDDGGSGSVVIRSLIMYISSLARFCAVSELSTVLSRPLLLVVVDDVDAVGARFGALRLGGSERVTGIRIDL